MLLLRACFFLLLFGACLELVLLVRIASRLGLVWTLAWLGGTCVLGLVLARDMQGRMLERLRNAATDGKRGSVEDLAVFRQLAATAVRGLAGLLLILPGAISDAAGLLLLVPGARPALAAVVRRLFTRLAVVTVREEEQGAYEKPSGSSKRADRRATPEPGSAATVGGTVRDAEFEILADGDTDGERAPSE